MQQLDSIELFCLENELNIFDLLSENNGKPAFHSIDESKWNEFIASFMYILISCLVRWSQTFMYLSRNLDQYATVFKNGIQKISEKLTSVQVCHVLAIESFLLLTNIF